MTVITSSFYDDRCYLEISGHACPQDGDGYCMPYEGDEGIGYDEETGHVCAAVSVLVMTVTEKLRRFESDGAFISSDVTVEPGYACFELEVRHGFADEVRYLLDTIMLGFELLEENYPECVSVA